MIPTRRAIIGAAGAAALSRILMPWRPTPSDILLADATPAEAAETVMAASPLPDVAFPAAGMVLKDEQGRVIARVVSMTANRSCRPSRFADNGWRNYEPGISTLDIQAVMTDDAARYQPGPPIILARS